MTVFQDRKELATVHHQQFTLFIIGGSKLSREGLRQLIQVPEFTGIRTFDRAENARETPTPDVILIDLAAERVAEDLRETTSVFPTVPVVVLSDSLSVKIFSSCLAAGINGYLLKDISAAALCAALHFVLLGGKVFPTDLAASLVCDAPHATSHHRRLSAITRYRLTRREMQILWCLVQGDSNKLIARRLDTTDATVKVQMKTLVRKIGVRNRTQAAVWAVANGLMSAAPAGIGSEREAFRYVEEDISASAAEPPSRALAARPFSWHVEAGEAAAAR